MECNAPIEFDLLSANIETGRLLLAELPAYITDRSELPLVFIASEQKVRGLAETRDGWSRPSCETVTCRRI